MSAAPDWDEAPKLVDLLIEEQQALTAVEVFSEFHDRAEPDVGRYEALMPTSRPDAASGEQYAFRVDLDACTGCKACVTACHNLNGLEEEETWRGVGLIESAQSQVAMEPVHQQTVTTACHHCAEPACLAGCPVNAYDKDPETGIVHHLDDQCIGCRYCQLMCPYDVPTYSERLGIVRKCDLCRGRLAEGEAPACVQGCPNEAIQVVVTSVAEPKASRLLPVAEGAMPDSSWTHPTTLYVSEKAPDVAASPTDAHRVVPSEGHLPLAIMLVLTQASVGMLCLSTLQAFWPASSALSSGAGVALISVAALLGLMGLGASTAHLGRPQWAFRAVLGLRTSWMSREIVVLGAYAGLLVGACALHWFDWAVATDRSFTFLQSFEPLIAFRPAVTLAAAGVGLLGAYCSVQIYAVTNRPLWRFRRTALRFATTGVIVGLGGLHLIAALVGAVGWAAATALLVAAMSSARFFREAGLLYSASGAPEALAFERTRLLLANDLKQPEQWRVGLQRMCGVALPGLILLSIAFGMGPPVQVFLAALMAAGLLASELLERSLFFRAEAMPSMPGAG